MLYEVITVDFIGAKSVKAKGKRITTFEVETINELEPVRFNPKTETPEKEQGNNDDEEDGGDNEDDATDATEEPKKRNITADGEKPEDGDDDDPNQILDDITGQLTLF